MQTHPELNVTNSSEQPTGRWTLTFRGGSGINLAYLATAFVAATDPHDFSEPSPLETTLREPHSVTDVLGDDLYSFEALPSLDALAEAQGVQPIEDIDDLVADFWPEDESVEDVIATIRRWRDEEDAPLS